MVGAKAREIYDREAKERMSAGKGDDGSGGRGHKKNPVENLPQGLEAGVLNPSQRAMQAAGKARDAVGKAVGVSGRSIDYATIISSASPVAVSSAACLR